MDFNEAASRSGYSVYTTEFDEIRDIREVYTDSTLDAFRREAEEYVHNGRTSPLAAGAAEGEPEELERAVAELRERIAAAIAENGIPASDTVLGFLMDNSGSLKKLRPVFARAMSRVCAALEELGFGTAVVGHTTVGWKGGEARRKWLGDGRPASPGRLNDLLITVYKEADEPIVEGDLRLYGLNSPPETYKENIDGEALAWMAAHLVETGRPNQSLVFVSDGDFPCDDSTLSLYGMDYLLHHRNAVIDEITSASDIQLSHVVATTEEVPGLRPARHAMPRFGGYLTRSSELVRAIADGLENSLRNTPAAVPVHGRSITKP